MQEAAIQPPQKYPCTLSSHQFSLACHAAPADSLDALLGQAGASSNQPLNASVVTERAPPGVASNYATAGQQHDFDNLQGTSVGRGGQPQVRRVWWFR